MRVRVAVVGRHTSVVRRERRTKVTGRSEPETQMGSMGDGSGRAMTGA